MLKYLALGITGIFSMGCMIGVAAELAWPLHTHTVHHVHHVERVEHVEHVEPPAQPVAWFRAEVTVASPAGTRVHALELAEGTCAAAGEKSDLFEDDFSVCVTAEPGAAAYRVTTAGSTRAWAATDRAMSQYVTRGQMRVGATGGTMTTGRSDGASISTTLAPAG